MIVYDTTNNSSGGYSSIYGSGIGRSLLYVAGPAGPSYYMNFA
jgi:hypothetical protein